MSSLVKLTPLFKPLGIKPEDRKFITATSDNLGALIGGNFSVLNKDGEEGELKDDIIKVNQIVVVTPSIPLRTSKYTILVSYNPRLAEVAAINCPSILPPGEEVKLTLKAFKNFSIEEFTDMYTFIIYALD